MSKVEHGARPVSAEDIRRWCEVCGVPRERTEELLAEQSAAAGMWLSYQRLNRAGLKAAQASVRADFETAALVRGYQCKIFPGLLQTARYTTTVLHTARVRQGVQVDDVAEAVAERMDRQRVLRQAGHRFVFVIEESVLRHRVCELDIMREQLEHLTTLIPLPSVSLGIIPLNRDRRSVLPREAFAMFDSNLVSVELVSGVLSITQPKEIAMYLRDFNDLASIAVHGAKAQALIRAAISNL